MNGIFCMGTALFAGMAMDFCFGDPYWLPHPVRLLGRLIRMLEKIWYREEEDAAGKRAAGRRLVLTVLLFSFLAPSAVLAAAFLLHPVLGTAAASVLCYQLLATKCLKKESMKVYDAATPEAARQAVSMIVGRDTEHLDEAGVIRAAVETVAENTTDGSVAPLFYMLLGGPVLGFVYKAVNTMDSMLGYKNERYLDFGRAAAKTDDAFNFLPARLAAGLMTAASWLCGYDAKGAARIHRRDAHRHASPNSAQTESVCAGALGIRLAGDAWYFGKKVEKPAIGDDLRPVEKEDIKRANRLLYGTVFLMGALGVLWYGGLLLACGI